MAEHAAETPPRRRIRALLAGAAVLGLGSLGTLALWTDTEFFNAAFNALARFRVEAATSSAGPWAPHGSVGDAATLTFELSGQGLVENEPVSAEFWLRMNTEAAASVQILAPTVEDGELNDYITVSIDSGTCSAPVAELQEGLLGELIHAEPVAAFDLPGGQNDQPGTAQPVCITATLGDTSDLPAGEYSTSHVFWEFLVTEKEA